MSVLVTAHSGVTLRGGGNSAYLCGRCGRILAFGIEANQILNVWVTCPKCEWLNGFDLDLGWAKYVVDQLVERKLSVARLAELLEDARNVSLSPEEFAERNPDAGPAVHWLRRISVSTLVAVLALLSSIYLGQKSLNLAEESLRVDRESRDLAEGQLKKQAAPTLSEEDVLRIARELHKLQEEVRLKPPPDSPRRAQKSRHRSSKRGQRR